ncbi:hypothetical protein PM082_007583 [Marasmius tenuissimus]|nr:hypothetical protein PM082_007583 [Marasmius tenuissimus]
MRTPTHPHTPTSINLEVQTSFKLDFRLQHLPRALATSVMIVVIAHFILPFMFYSLTRYKVTVFSPFFLDLNYMAHVVFDKMRWYLSTAPLRQDKHLLIFVICY